MAKRSFNPKEVSLLLKKINEAILKLEQIKDKDKPEIDLAVKCSNELAQKEIIKILEEIPVEELNRDKDGFRIKNLKDAHYNTIADIVNTSLAALERINGISKDTAKAIKKKADALAKDAKKQVKLQLDLENKTSGISNLLLALSKYISLKPFLSEVRQILNDYENINKDLTLLKEGTSGVKWLFANNEKKDAINRSYDVVNDFYNIKLKDNVDELVKRVNRILRKQASVAYQEFRTNPSLFLATLDQLNPGILYSKDDVYGLPQELATEIDEQRTYLDGLNATLRRYQEWGVKYILHQGNVLLGDEMGLGKTLQAIATMVSLRNLGAKHFIVVCPLSVLTNWEREIKKFSDLNVVKVHGPTKEVAFEAWKSQGGVAITTYETTSIFDLEDKFKYEMLILDEAHYIKNKDALRSKNIELIKDNAKRILYMSGTPLENKVDEMIKLIRDLNPTLASQIQKVAYLSSAKQFKEKIAPVYYRRKREDVLRELPEKIETLEWCELNKEEERIYEDSLLNHKFAEARQLSWNIDDLNKSSKANRLKEIVEMAKEDDRKVLVFSFFLNTIFKVKEFLGDAALDPIYGEVSAEKRQLLIDEFDKSEAGTVLISQIVSGGTGLNIQSASVVVFLEPQFKPSIENQAIARAYRMGQLRTVLVYRLVANDTIDERILSILEEKSKAFDAFADESLAAKQSLEIDEKGINNILEEEIDRIKAKRLVSSN